jgi:hypothetical protein
MTGTGASGALGFRLSALGRPLPNDDFAAVAGTKGSPRSAVPGALRDRPEPRSLKPQAPRRASAQRRAPSAFADRAEACSPKPAAVSEVALQPKARPADSLKPKAQSLPTAAKRPS